MGSLGGHGLGAGQDHLFSETFQEFGYVMVIARILPKTAYFQGLNRKWKRFDRLDFPIPDMAHVGEQEVYDYELFYDWDGSQGASDGVFGYSERYAEVKHATNRISGDFRDTFDTWHLARKFTSAPSLNSTFVEVQNDGNIHRCFADTSTSNDKFLMSIWFEIKAKKPLPYFSTPRLIG